MITKQNAAILVLAALLSACRSSDSLPDDPLIYPEQEQESAFIPTYSKTVVAGWPKGRSLDPRDASRVRLDEQVHAYHLGRLPSKDRQEMHEAHTVYRVEQDARWDTRLPSTPMDSRGVVLGIRDPSRKEIPDDDLIKQERQALAAKSDALRKSMSDLEVLRAELLKKKSEFQKAEEDVAGLKEYLAKTLQDQATLQAQLKQTQERLNEMEEAERLRIRNSSQNLVPKK
ncbi:MAG: hypothetical protein JNN17_13150 [Verrucomicrobiaceae bacterium]|nr:hypothetical protein [Verrucomicrobiaceae bacterium]